jgi:transposase-like protein
MENPLNLTEHQARQYLERIRWPHGVVCPYCQTQAVGTVEGKSARAGLYQCKQCRKQFTVTVGTIFERSHIPLAKWVQAYHLLCSSKKGMSSLQLSRMLGITYKSAWHLAHRIRYAMQPPKGSLPLRGTVEVDETYVGGAPSHKAKTPMKARKTPVVAMVAREGEARSKAIPNLKAKSLSVAMRQQINPAAVLMTDEAPAYEQIGKKYGRHLTVKHSAFEYVRGQAYTNTVESFFALLKRGIMGSYHHVSRKHLTRYCDEFSFRWSHRNVSDRHRTKTALRQSAKQQLTYQRLIDRN